MSRFFDTQYRQWCTSMSNYTADNSSYVVPTSKTLTLLSLENKHDIIDGLIADFESVAIRFRNHSVPIGLAYGGGWEEDILWREPKVHFVPIIISIWKRPASQFTSADGLVDCGGFVELNRTNPFPGDDNRFTYGQDDPHLYDRAFYAA